MSFSSSRKSRPIPGISVGSVSRRERGFTWWGRWDFLDDRAVKRAGLDYWADVDVREWDSLADLQSTAGEEARFFFLTTKTDRAYWSAEFCDGDYLVFGPETRGLPESLLAAHADHCLTIPQFSEKIRSLNLATAVGIVLYEAVRQQS